MQCYGLLRQLQISVMWLVTHHIFRGKLLLLLPLLSKKKIKVALGVTDDNENENET